MDKLVLGDAGALVAFSSAANAGITIPAGDWTVDLGGNVNAFYTHTSLSGATAATATNTVQTGLLPSALGIGAKTRQNDLDISFQFTFFTGADSGGQSSAGNNTLNIRQAFMTFGDASWGTIKLGRDLGVYASDAILSDMTLLGVGTAAGNNGSSTLGRIGSGYQYADWKGQIQYQSPNWNGFQLTGAVTQGWKNAYDTTNSNMGYEGKATYDFAANDVNGRVWVSGIYQQHDTVGANAGYDSKGWDLGAKAAYQGAELVGYYYNGDGLSGATTQLVGQNFMENGLPYFGATNQTKDSGGYVQATFKVPGVGTKLGASWGESMSTASTGGAEFKNESWIIGAYHPLTKSLNLVAEYTDNKFDNIGNVAGSNGKARTTSIGAIMFF
jgi:predicted porin